MKRNHTLLAALVTLIAALTTTGLAGDPHSKSKRKLPPLPPGPEWADTNRDGKLSDAELKHAEQILNAKIQKLKSESTKTAKK